jgi:hypothetical protein
VRDYFPANLFMLYYVARAQNNFLYQDEFCMNFVFGQKFRRQLLFNNLYFEFVEGVMVIKLF